jgi:hypothetical protein
MRLTTLSGGSDASFYLGELPGGVIARYVSGTTASEPAQSFPINGFTNTRSMTFIGRLTATLATGVGVMSRAGTNQILIRRDGTGFGFRLGGTNYAAAGAFNYNTAYDYAVVGSNSGAQLWANGLVTNSATVPASENLPASYFVGYDAGGGGAGDVIWEWFAMFATPLSAFDLNAIWRHPYRTLLAPRQIYIPTEAAASGPTVVAVTPTTIGSTSHRPRYTWTPA